jgi:hypothetical protein
MKKIIMIAFIFLGLTSSNSNNDEWATIYCKPNLESCIHNLDHLELWLELDFKDGKISENEYEAYKLVVENTSRSIEMILDPLGCQCDTNKGKKVNLLDTRGKTPKWVKN